MKSRLKRVLYDCFIRIEQTPFMIKKTHYNKTRNYLSCLGTVRMTSIQKTTLTALTDRISMYASVLI